jgi:short-subunit dehydrogenase
MHVAITGASSGIGAALAREFARAGHSISLVSRRRDLLESLAGELNGKTHVAAHDLSEPTNATAWIADAERALGPIDVLVNNAGIQVIGWLLEVPIERLEAELHVNLLSPLRITRAVLPAMLKRRSGVIVDVASMAAIAPTPFMNYYNASKAGLAAASESLRGELMGTGVHVVTVYPGPIDTPMGTAGYAAYEPSKSASATPVGTPEVLARLVRRAVERRRPRVIYPRIYAITRWFPGTTRYFLDRFTPKPRALKSGTEQG